TFKGSSFRQHSYPEALLRIGAFADWLEFRVAQNFISGTGHVPGPAELERPAHTTSESASGAQDLNLGIKLGLTEQKRLLPESALILQMTVPTGSGQFTNGEVLPGVNYDFSWEVVKERFSIEGVISANGARDDVDHSYVSVATGLTGICNLTRDLEMFS